MDKDHKYLAFCEAGATIFSTCAKRQYFAIVLDSSGRQVGAGYNGAPPGARHCSDGGCPRLAEGSASGTVYDNCVSNHAEQNALMYSDHAARRGGTIVVNGTPCWGCAKLIAGAGLKRLVCLFDPSYEDWPRTRAMLDEWGIEIREIVP
jgi:dCMP deaminase